MNFLGLRQRSENIDWQGFKGSGCREYSKGARPSPELHAVVQLQIVLYIRRPTATNNTSRGYVDTCGSVRGARVVLCVERDRAHEVGGCRVVRFG